MFKENLPTSAEPTILPWLAFFVSIAAALGVIYNVYLSRKTAKQRATLEFLDEYKNDRRIFEALLFIPKLKGEKNIMPDLRCRPQDLENIVFLLNKYEILAVGLKHKIYDKKMLIDTLAVEAIRVYQYCESLIMEMRESNTYQSIDPKRKGFSGFEALAKELDDLLSKK